VWEKAPFLALSAASCVVTFLVQQKGDSVTSLTNLSVGGRLENAAVSYARYLGKSVWPVNLALPYPLVAHWPAGWVILAAGVVAGLSVAALGFARRLPFVLTGWFWFLGTLIPVIGIVQVGNQAMADRYAYVPFVGLFMIAAWGGAALAVRWRLPQGVAGVAAALVLAACAARTVDQLRYWRNSETLFTHSIAVSERNYVAESNLGSWLFTHERPEEAAVHFRNALKIKPDDWISHNNMGSYWLSQGRLDEATGHYLAAVRAHSAFPQAWHSLGVIYQLQRRYADAMQCYERVIALRPRDVQTMTLLGDVCYEEDRYAEAIDRYRAALRLDPAYPGALNNMGSALFKSGDRSQAIESYKAAVRAKPDYVDARRNLAAALQDAGRDGEAAAQYREVLRLNPKDAAAHGGLADVLARQGRMDEAVQQLNEVLQLKPGDAEAREGLRRLGMPAAPSSRMETNR
jgi:tetratricopeptide (TPR) repeat protein